MFFKIFKRKEKESIFELGDVVFHKELYFQKESVFYKKKLTIKTTSIVEKKETSYFPEEFTIEDKKHIKYVSYFEFFSYKEKEIDINKKNRQLILFNELKCPQSLIFSLGEYMYDYSYFSIYSEENIKKYKKELIKNFKLKYKPKKSYIYKINQEL